MKRIKKKSTYDERNQDLTIVRPRDREIREKYSSVNERKSLYYAKSGGGARRWVRKA